MLDTVSAHLAVAAVTLSHIVICSKDDAESNEKADSVWGKGLTQCIMGLHEEFLM